MFGKHRTDVLVVGAGPVGLVTALRLHRAKVGVRIVDSHRRTGVHSYGLALHGRSLRILHELGLAEPLVAQGRRIDSVGFYEGDTERARLDLTAPAGLFSFVLVIPQRTLESTVEQQLEHEGLKVMWNHRLQALDPLEDEVHAEVARLDQAPFGYPIARLEWIVDRILDVHSRFVVGADGYNSFVRGALESRYERRGPDMTFSVFELDSPIDLEDELRVHIADGSITSVLWPMPDGRCRWSFRNDRPTDHRPTLDDLRTRLTEYVPWFPRVTGELHWSSQVRFDRRLAEFFGDDRIWLAGDAAHLTSPVGVQSLNGGIVDARELAGALEIDLADSGVPSATERYGTSRRAEWQALFDANASLGFDASVDPWVREHAATILAAAPATGPDLAAILAPIGLRFASSVPA